MVPDLQSNLSEADDWPLPAAVAGLVETAAALFDVDRSTSYQFLNRAVALVRATRPPAKCHEASRYQERPRRGLAAWQISRVTTYIRDNLEASLTAQNLADQVNLSAGQFFRAFKASVGLPPFQYILRKRLELACRMMETTDESLSQIAIACGLCDQSHLCRMFRRMVGESPDAWRRKNNPGRAARHSR
jgi:AraC family transcriptional regulator